VNKKHNTKGNKFWVERKTKKPQAIILFTNNRQIALFFAANKLNK